MDLKKRKAEIEGLVDQINTHRKILYTQLDTTESEFKQLEREYQLIEKMLEQASSAEENENGKETGAD